MLPLSFCVPSADCDESVPPDARFFSLASPLAFNLPSSEKRFAELLLVVILRVAQRDRCVTGSGAPLPGGAMPAMMTGSRARPDHPKMPARVAKTGPDAVTAPLQSSFSQAGLGVLGGCRSRWLRTNGEKRGRERVAVLELGRHGGRSVQRRSSPAHEPSAEEMPARKRRKVPRRRARRDRVRNLSARARDRLKGGEGEGGERF